MASETSVLFSRWTLPPLNLILPIPESSFSMSRLGRDPPVVRSAVGASVKSPYGLTVRWLVDVLPVLVVLSVAVVLPSFMVGFRKVAVPVAAPTVIPVAAPNAFTVVAVVLNTFCVEVLPTKVPPRIVVVVDAEAPRVTAVADKPTSNVVTVVPNKLTDDEVLLSAPPFRNTSPVNVAAAENVFVPLIV